MKFKVDCKPDLVKLMVVETKLAAKATTRALRDAGCDLKGDWRTRITAAGLGKNLARSIREQTYPKRGVSLGAASIVWSKAPEIVMAHDKGGVIRAKSGRYLAIPTGYNKPSGRRAGNKPLVSPQKMVAMKKWTYVLPTQDGHGLVWFMRVSEAASMSQTGRITRRVFVGGMKLSGRGYGDVGSGRKSRVDAILKHGAVPMFVLLPQVRLSQRLDLERGVSHAQSSVPARIVEHWIEGHAS
ncbi:MAG: DUF6441 family protein [Hyphomicrobiales bacterium]